MAAHSQVLEVYQQGLEALGGVDGSLHEHMVNYLGETLEDLLEQAAEQESQVCGYLLDAMLHHY